MSKSDDVLLTPDECTKERQNGNFKIEDEVYDSLLYCRTCASKDAFLIPIYKGEGLTHELNEKIEKYLPIHVTKDDDLPLQLCYNCASTIIAWHSLMIGCVEAEKKLKSLQSSLTKGEGLVNSKDEADERESEGFSGVSNNLDSDDEPLIAKKIANVKTVTKRTSNRKGATEEKSIVDNVVQNEEKRENLDASPSSSPDKLPELSNRDESGSEPDWSRPSLETVQVSPKRASQGGTRDKRVFKCEICNKVLNRRFNYERHLLVHTGQTLTCHECGKQYRGQSVLDRHIKVIHQQIRVSSLSCDCCGRGFSSRQSLEDHYRTHTGERPFMCEICGKDFRATPNLIAHKKIHTGHLPFKCDLCDYRCRLKSTLIDHSQRHEGKKTCLCSVCGKGFVNNYDLSKHKKTHSKDRLFSCTSCNLTFVMKRYLKVHMKTHVQKAETKAPTFKNSMF